MNNQTKWLKLKRSTRKFTNMNVMRLPKELSKILHLLSGFLFPLVCSHMVPHSSSISLQQIVLSKTENTIQN
jgi:hypothetical protein